jgi:hypothetical protein
MIVVTGVDSPQIYGRSDVQPQVDSAEDIDFVE